MLLNRRIPILLYLTTFLTVWLAGAAPAVIRPRPDPPPATSCGGTFEPPRDEISPAEEQAMWEEIQRNLNLLRNTGALAAPKAAPVVTYTFPLRLAPGLPDTNLQDSFIPPGNIYFYTYYRDYQGGLVTQLTIYRPDGSVFQTWPDVPADNTFNSAAFRARVFTFSVNEPAGTWRLEAIYNGQVYETFFNVNAPPTLALNSPNGGEQWDILLAHPVTWADNFGGDVNIALYHNGVYTATLAHNTPSDGGHLWVPGLAIAPGPGYTIRVTSVLNPAVYDESNTPFTLLPTVFTHAVYLPLVIK